MISYCRITVILALFLFLPTMGPAYSQEASLEKARELNQQVVDLYGKGQYTEAIPIAKRTLAILEKAMGPEHPSIAASLNNLAMLYYNMSDYAKAEPLLQRTLAIREKALGPEHPDTATSLNNLAALYVDMGDYAKAEPLGQRALAIREKTLGSEHRDTVYSLITMVKLHTHMSEYDRAEPLGQRALAICEKIMGPKHPDTALCLNELAELYRRTYDFEKARPLYQRALAIYEKIFGPEHPRVSTILNNLALVHRDIDKTAEAKLLFQRALAIKEKTYGMEHPNTAIAIHNIAGLYREMGNYAEAESLYQRALAINVKILGPEHPNTATSLRDLASVNIYLGKIRNAYLLESRAQAIDQLMIELVSEFRSESETLAFLGTRKWTLLTPFSLVNLYLYQDTSITVDAVNLWLNRKGFVLDAQKRFHEALIYNDNPEAIQTFQELSKIRAQLSRLTFGSPGKDGIDAYKANINRLNKQKLALETRLVQISQAFAAKQKMDKADCAKISESLPEKTALVEFARIGQINFNKEKVSEEKWLQIRYLAFVIRAGKGDRVEWIDLGPADRVDETIASFRKEMLIGDINSIKVGESSKKLYTLVFEPLKKGIGDVTELFISPDGNLNLIPFEVLQTPGGRFLIEDYSFNYLAVGRDILGFGKSENKSGKALIIGDPDFDLGVDEKTNILRRLDLDRSESGESGKRSTDMQGLHFKRLPGTREEVMEIGALLGSQKAEVYTGKEALEELLRRKSAPSILHIATHGFFLNDLDLSALADTRLVQMASMEPVASGKVKIENPLLRSGIALAGANNALRAGDREKSDGIVTAEKILGLRLRGTDMVVLSACETGLGEVKAGEGVFGLRRAFTQAGTRSMVMSLWSVPDRETKELMVGFLAQRPEKRHSRFNEGQRCVLAMCCGLSLIS